jgi:hypothetical protein
MTPSVKNYVPGSWFTATSIDEMEEFFLSRLSAIRYVAKVCGYALGLHGSCRRDFDLIAVPWIENPSSIDFLAHQIALAACGITRDSSYDWESKPLGRFATSIPICWTEFPVHQNTPGLGHIDLSVMPGHKTEPIGELHHYYANLDPTGPWCKSVLLYSPGSSEDRPDTRVTVFRASPASPWSDTRNPKKET